MKKGIQILSCAVALIAAFSFTLNNPSTTGLSPNFKMAKVGTNVGDLAPELDMATLDGKTMKLSDMRGKIVLIDFWASWCGPCRKENPNVVQAYNKYKKAKFKTAEGFDILSVSLDSNKEAWEKAVKKDNLTWDGHISDLKSWNSEAAAIYGVRSIPFSFLVDENGIIVAKALRGLQLHMEIDKHVKKL